MMRLLRTICAVHTAPAEEEELVSILEVLQRLRRESPAWVVVLARLRTLMRSSRQAPNFALALIQSPGGVE